MTQQRVLLVDDSPTVFEFVRQALPTYRVDRLTSFVDLPSYLREGVPFVVILDVEMPALSGQDFARFLRRCTPADIPIVLYSSVDDQRLAQIGAEVGARLSLRKSGDPTVLRRALQSIAGAA